MHTLWERKFDPLFSKNLKLDSVLASLPNFVCRDAEVFFAKLFSFACVEALLSSNLAERSVVDS